MDREQLVVAAVWAVMAVLVALWALWAAGSSLCAMSEDPCQGDLLGPLGNRGW